VRIACVGAGPAGLYLAILMKLRDAKNEITIFERNPAGIDYGWGVVFWDDLRKSLNHNDPQSAREIVEHSFRWNGQVIDAEGKGRAHHKGGGYGICRRKLLAILTERAMELGVKIEYEHEVASAGQLPDADLVVVADGGGSRLRRNHEDRFKTRVDVGRNKYVWLGTTKIFAAFTFGFAQTEAGWIWFHAYAFKRNMSTFIVECSPETWTGLRFDNMDTSESLGRLEEIFEQHLDGHRLIAHNGKGASLPWLKFRTVVNRTWHKDNIVLVGDAAHTTHFTIGSGTRLAIEDAIALADALGEQDRIQAALATYESERKRELRIPAQDARLSARWFERVPRYISFDGPEFATLLLSRRSRLMPQVPPGVYCRLTTTLRRAPALKNLYRWTAAMVGRLDRLRSQP
jgi:anthraniloyl-CoA monooxygenase